MSANIIPSVASTADARATVWRLGMTWSPLGILGAPSKLIVRGRLVREGAVQR